MRQTPAVCRPVGHWLALTATCLQLFAALPAAADPHPLIPPLACCENGGMCCPCDAACCIPVAIPCIADYAGAAPQQWNITLEQAVQLALSNSEAVRNLGLVEANSRNDLVRSIITTYDPLISRSEAAAEWGIFDPVLTSSIEWNRENVPPGTTFSGIGTRPPLLDTAFSGTSVEQLLPLGTVIRMDMVTDYLFNPLRPANLSPNPQYFSYGQFSVVQPLLQDLGVDVTVAPIKIACAKAQQTNWQFKQEMLALVRSVETTFWDLYAQRRNLLAIEATLPLFAEAVRLRQEQAEAKLGAGSDVARARSDLLLFEQRRLETKTRIAEMQLVLRNLMGVAPNAHVDIQPLAISQGAPAQSLQAAVATAVNRRPDVLRQRLAVYISQQERLVADNAVKPRLDVSGFYRTNGLGDDVGSSYGSISNNNFDSWQLGVFFEIPLGRREGFANLRAADYRIARERAMLQQTVHQASFEVADAYRRIDWVTQQREVVDQRLVALNEWRDSARAQFKTPPPGVSPAFALEFYLQNLRDGLDTAIHSNALLAEFNSALARLEEVKGTLLERRYVVIAGDPTEEMSERLPADDIQLPESVGEVLTPPEAEPAAPQNNQPQQDDTSSSPYDFDFDGLAQPQESADSQAPVVLNDPTRGQESSIHSASPGRPSPAGTAAEATLVQPESLYSPWGGAAGGSTPESVIPIPPRPLPSARPAAAARDNGRARPIWSPEPTSVAAFEPNLVSPARKAVNVAQAGVEIPSPRGVALRQPPSALGAPTRAQVLELRMPASVAK